MAKPTLTFSLIVRDEEKHIGRCLKSILPAADEIVVVDTGSKDRTVQIAKKYGARVIQAKWEHDYAKVRNISLWNSTSDWVFSIDADEALARKDLQKLRKLMQTNRYVAYWVTTRNYRNDPSNPGWEPDDGKYKEAREFYGWFPTTKVRLFKNMPEVYWEGVVHEDLYRAVGRMGGKIGATAIPVHHFQDLKGQDVVRKKQKKYFELGKKKIKKFGRDPLVNFDLGAAYFSFGYYDQAIKYLKKSLELDPCFDFAYYELGITYEKIGRHKKAIAAFQGELKINPKKLMAWVRLGFIYEGIGEHKKALQAYRKAVKINPAIIRVFPRLKDIHHLL